MQGADDDRGAGWSDLNAHDPGITVLGLFAFMAVGVAGVAAARRWRKRRHAPGDAS